MIPELLKTDENINKTTRNNFLRDINMSYAACVWFNVQTFKTYLKLPENTNILHTFPAQLDAAQVTEKS